MKKFRLAIQHQMAEQVYHYPELCFDELRKGNIGLVVATQIARYVAPENNLPGWHSPER